MSEELIFALQVSGVGIVVLLLVLSLLALVISLMTRYIVDKPEQEETTEVSIPAPLQAEKAEGNNLEIIAAIAVAYARAQMELSAMNIESAAGEMDSWRQFKIFQRLNQASTIRRMK